MAVLGIQFVITLMMATVLSRVGPHLSLASCQSIENPRWLLTGRLAGLVRYLHPSDEELRQFAPAPRYYTEYQWLLDFSCYSLFTYILSELYISLLPAKAATEVNLSLVWVVLVLIFTYKLLLSLNGLYFEGEEAGGERSLVLVMGGAYLLFAMMVLVVNEDTLETGLEEAYSSFNNSAATFLHTNAGLDSSGPASKLVLKFFIALWCGLIGALFTFPGLRVARMHWDVLRYHEASRSKVLLHIGFIAPLVLTCFWVRPLTREPLTVRIYRGRSEPLMTSAEFESLRLYLVAVTILFRLVLMPRYLQAYLNLAYDKVNMLRQEAGKISNVDLQRIVIRVFYYLCVVTLQYVAPMILILYLSFLYKTLGGGSWIGQPSTTPSAVTNSSMSEVEGTEEFPEAVADDNEVTLESLLPAQGEQTVEALQEQFSLAWSSLKHVFTTEVFRGLLGFSTWWCCFVWFASAAIGIGYQSYFAESL